MGGGLGGRFRWDVCETLGHMLRRLETGYRGNTVSSSVENSVGERHRTERRGEEKRGKERRGKGREREERKLGGRIWIWFLMGTEGPY